MLHIPSYKEAWKLKRQWCRDNSYIDKLITSEDEADGSSMLHKLRLLLESAYLTNECRHLPPRSGAFSKRMNSLEHSCL